MNLTFLYHPVTNLAEAVAYYRDTLGLDEAWREGDDTVAFAVPGSEVTIMLDLAPDGGGPCGFFGVDDIDAFHAERKDTVQWTVAPEDLGPIRHAAFTDPAGNMIRIFQNPTE